MIIDNNTERQGSLNPEPSKDQVEPLPNTTVELDSPTEEEFQVAESSPRATIVFSSPPSRRVWQKILRGITGPPNVRS